MTASQTPPQQDYVARTDHRRCPYCGAPTELIDSGEIYHGTSYGQAWICRPCQAWVGCHRGTSDPLGTLANAPLRAARHRAHAALDRLWKRGRRGDRQRRSDTYRWLAAQLGIAQDDCHIGHFDEDTCQQVVEICEEHAP
jgi:hypothetical protein